MQKSYFITSDNIKIVFQYIFSTPIFVFLLHGLGGGKENWNCLMNFLSPFATIVAWDMRGHGESGKPEQGYTLERISKDLYELMAILKIKRASIIGHSLGSKISAKFAVKYHEYIDKLILISFNPMSGNINSFLQVNNVESAFKLFQELDPGYCALQLSYLINPFIENSPIFEKFKSISLDIKLSDITAPTLIIFGQRDSRVPFTVALYTREHIPNSVLSEFYNQGHDLYLTNSTLFNLQVYNFLFVSCDICKKI